MRTVTVTQTTRSALRSVPKKTKVKPHVAAFKYCDSNIQAKTGTTTCGFANNVFYEYWTSGETGSIRVYSPTTGTTYRVLCGISDPVICRAGDGGVVKFSQASVDRYDQQQADAYALKGTLGPSSTAERGNSQSPAPDSSTPTPDEGNIPNYDNGNGYRVQCADGEYSQSGGIQGACSGHGGER